MKCNRCGKDVLDQNNRRICKNCLERRERRARIDRREIIKEISGMQVSTNLKDYAKQIANQLSIKMLIAGISVYQQHEETAIIFECASLEGSVELSIYDDKILKCVGSFVGEKDEEIKAQWEEEFSPKIQELLERHYP